MGVLLYQKRGGNAIQYFADKEAARSDASQGLAQG